MTRKRSSRDKRQRPERSEILEAGKDAADYTAASPKLSGGDVDADWKRAASAREEAVGGSVATPDQDRVDDIGDALGVPRAPDDEIRTSAEILEERDRYRWEEEE
jgi:Family of unknown function (DUF6335)